MRKKLRSHTQQVEEGAEELQDENEENPHGFALPGPTPDFLRITSGIK
jgi:hypothetical protein